MSWVRTWLPVAIIVAGFVLAAVTGFSDTGLEGGALLVSAGLSVWLINLLYRVGVRAIASATTRTAHAPISTSTGAGPTRSGAGMAAEHVDSPDGRRGRR